MNRCLFGRECLQRHNNEPAPVDTFSLCPACRTDSFEDITNLRRDYAELGDRLEKVQRPAEVYVSGNKPGSSPPINLAVDTLRSDISRTALDAEDVVRDVAGMWPRSPLRPRAFDVDVALRVVAGHVEDLAAARVVPTWVTTARRGFDLLRALRRLHRHCGRLLGRDTLQPLPGMCPGCHAHAIGREEGSSLIGCRACGRYLGWEEYQQLITLTITPVPPGS